MFAISESQKANGMIHLKVLNKTYEVQTHSDNFQASIKDGYRIGARQGQFCSAFLAWEYRHFENRRTQNKKILKPNTRLSIN